MLDMTKQKELVYNHLSQVMGSGYIRTPNVLVPSNMRKFVIQVMFDHGYTAVFSPNHPTAGGGGWSVVCGIIILPSS